MDRPTPALYDPRVGDPPVRVTSLQRSTDDPPRTNYFTVLWVEAGAGTLWVDAARHVFRPRSLLFFNPYQHVHLDVIRPIRGERIEFHANFLCIETYHHEIGCNGVLFNDPFGSPVVKLDARTGPEAADLIARIHRELTEAGPGHAEVLLSYLKVLLVLATRVKLDTRAESVRSTGKRPEILTALHDLIEANYRTLHAPAEYAELLHTTPKVLGRLVHGYHGKTLSALIRDRILIHAKWQLLHTLRPVKEIAHELGYDDQLYFSRLFKKATGYSPTYFRTFETAIRGGSNLSISSAAPSIPPPPPCSHNADIPANTRGRHSTGGKP